MKLKISFCHSAIIKNNFTRFYPLLIAYTLVWMLCLPFVVYSQLSYQVQMKASTIEISNSFKGLVLSGTNGIIISIAAIIIVMIMFSYLFKGKSCNMYHALPLNRQQLFFSNFILGLCFLIFPLVFNFIVLIIIGSLFNCLAINVIVLWFVATVLISFFFYSFAIFCAMFTGNILALPAFYFILNFLTVGIEMLIISLFTYLIYGLNYMSGTQIADILSPGYYILRHTYFDYDYLNGYKVSWGFLWYYALAAIVLIGISIFLYKRRNLETASDFVCIKWIKPIFLYGVAFCFSLSFTFFILSIFNLNYGSNILISVFVLMFIGGFFGYFIARMILFKSIKVIRNGMKGWIIYSVSVFLLIIFINSDAFGYQTNIPNADEVKSVSYSISHNADYLNADTDNVQEIIDIHKAFLANRASIQNELSQYYNGYTTADENINTCQNDINITYHLKNGKKINRSYNYLTDSSKTYAEDSPVGKIENFINDPEQIINSLFPSVTKATQLQEIKMDYLSSSDQVKTRSITGEDALAVYRAMIEDTKEGHLKLMTDYNNMDSSTTSCTLMVTFDESFESSLYTTEFTLPFTAKHTFQTLEDMGYISSIDDVQPYTDYN